MDRIKASYIDYRGFEFVKTLGRGTHGTVILVERKKDKQQYALKSIRKYTSNGELLKQLGRIKREVLIMASLRHPNIIAVHDVCESTNRVTMTMEYASGGELFEYVDQSKNGLPENEIKRLFRQISSAINCMHLAGIVHRDLKLENILLDHNKNAKIADFGLSNRFKRGELMFTFCGSPLYASPEIVTTTPYFGPEVDCWSLGVILYIMTFACMPFSANNLPQLREVIRTAHFSLPRPANYYLQHLIKGLLIANPHHRFNIKQVLSHPWLRCREDSQFNNFQQSHNDDFEHRQFGQGDCIEEKNDNFWTKFHEAPKKESNNEKNFYKFKKNDEKNTNLQKNQSYDFNDFALGGKFRKEHHVKHNSYITIHQKSREVFNYRKKDSWCYHDKHLKTGTIHSHKTKDKLYDHQQALNYKRQTNSSKAESKCDKLNNNYVIIEKRDETPSDKILLTELENENKLQKNKISRNLNKTHLKQTYCNKNIEKSSNPLEQTSRNNHRLNEEPHHHPLLTNVSSNEVRPDRSTSPTGTKLFPQHLQHHNTSPLRKNLHLQQSMDSLENFYDIFNDIHIQNQNKLLMQQSIEDKSHEPKKEISVGEGCMDNDSIDSFDRVTSLDLNHADVFENARRRSLSSPSESLPYFTIPIIEEVKNPKTIIMADEITVICDVKTTSTDQINLFGSNYNTSHLKVEKILIKKALSTPCIPKTILMNSCIEDIEKCIGPLSENINAFIRDGDCLVEYNSDEKSGKIEKDYYFDANNNAKYYNVIENVFENNLDNEVKGKKIVRKKDNKMSQKLWDVCHVENIQASNVMSSKNEKIQATPNRKNNKLYCHQGSRFNASDSTMNKNEVYGIFFNTKYSDDDAISIDSLDIQS